MPRKTKMNSLTSPELLAQVNPENMNLLNEFVAYLRSMKRSENTIDAYINDLHIVFVWCLQYNNNLSFIDWKKRHIIQYQNWLLYTNENSPARVRRLKASLSSLANYISNILDEDYPSFRNIINKVENPPNQPTREPAVWTEEEVEDLLARLVEQKQFEKACYLALAVYSGRRKAELCRFKVSDFDDSHLVCGGALYKSDPIKTKGRGDGKIIPCYTLAKKFKPYLDLWLEERANQGDDNSIWLFPQPGHPEEHIGISMANSWAKTFDRMSDKPFYNHAMRHTFTTELYKAGIPEGVIQAIQQWSTRDMVSVYCDLDADEEIGMYFKDGDIVSPSQKGIDSL